jgi:hypothetical protein
LNALETDELDRVLIHEWAHVQRRDDLTNIVQVVVRATVGWHPALRWIDRRLQVEREIACDETTTAMTGSPKAYAECLMKLADLGGREPMHASTALLTSSGLRARITKIVAAQPSIAPLWSRTIAAGSVAALGLLTMQLSALRLVQAAVLEVPIVVSQTVGTSVQRAAPMTAPLLSSDIEAARWGQTPRRVPTVQHPRRGHVSAEPGSAATNAVTLDSGPVPSSAVQPEVHRDSPLLPVVATLPEMPAEHRVTPVEKRRAPWAVAADGGTAIGRKSKDAGVATAGFFSRFGHRVAGSF